MKYENVLVYLGDVKNNRPFSYPTLSSVINIIGFDMFDRIRSRYEQNRPKYPGRRSFFCRTTVEITGPERRYLVEKGLVSQRSADEMRAMLGVSSEQFERIDSDIGSLYEEGFERRKEIARLREELLLRRRLFTRDVRRKKSELAEKRREHGEASQSFDVLLELFLGKESYAMTADGVYMKLEEPGESVLGSDPRRTTPLYTKDLHSYKMEEIRPILDTDFDSIFSEWDGLETMDLSRAKTKTTSLVALGVVMHETGDSFDSVFSTYQELMEKMEEIEGSDTKWQCKNEPEHNQWQGGYRNLPRALLAAHAMKKAHGDFGVSYGLLEGITDP
jgi:hypothetical protein